MLQKIRSSINNDTALVLFKSMILPYLEFANSLLIGCTQRDTNKLQRLQNRGLSLALGRNSFYGTVDLHREARLACWDSRARIALCRLVYKRKYNYEFLVDRRDTRWMDQCSVWMSPDLIPSGGQPHMKVKGCGIMFRLKYVGLMIMMFTS